MVDPKSEQYGLEPGDGSPADAPSPAPPLRKPELERPADVEPLQVEIDLLGQSPQPVREGKPSVKELDVCPNCGASMRGVDTLLCLRCGFDLKTMKVVKTVTGEAAAPAAADGAEEGEPRVPLVVPGRGDVRFPAILTGISAAILCIGYLAGVGGLFHPDSNGGVDHSVTARLIGLLRFIVVSLMWTGCGIGALGFLAQLRGNSFGNLRLAAVRVLAIVVTIQLATLINFNSTPAEWTVEAIIQTAAFIGLAMALFALPARDAATLAAATVILFMLLWLGAFVVVWATG